MRPSKIIFYTRPWEVHFHCNLARSLQSEFPEAAVLFVSFFSRAVHIAQEAGFETLFFPTAFQKAKAKPATLERLQEIDGFCRSEYMGLNAMLYTERFLPTEPGKAQEFLNAHISVLDEIVDERTLSVSSMYDHFVYLAAGMLAFMKGGAHFAFVGCGVPAGRVIALRTPWKTWENPATEEDPNGLLIKAVEEVRLPSEDRIEYMRRVSPSKRKLFDKIRPALLRRKCAKADYKAGSYFPTRDKSWPLNALSWRFSKITVGHRVPEWDIRTSDELLKIEQPYVFLALHMEPEATILMYSPYLRDQQELARLVSQSLPPGHLLLVKENPKMIGRRHQSYFTKLKKLPNLLLISATVSSSDLIGSSVGVVSLSGTVTIEAYLHGKPSLCVGNAPFSGMATARGAELWNSTFPLGSEHELREPVGLTEEWVRWIKGTFEGSSTPVILEPELGNLVMNAQPENVQKFQGYILGCLSDSRNEKGTSGSRVSDISEKV